MSTDTRFTASPPAEGLARPPGHPAAETVPPLAEPVRPPELALALGIPETSPMGRALSEQLPAQLLPGWRVQAVATSTDVLITAAQQPEARHWTTLLVTYKLLGTVTLASALFRVRQVLPTLRIAVLMDRDTPEHRRLMAACAQCGIHNLVVGTLDFPVLADAITRDWTWQDSVARYVDAETNPPRLQPAPALAPPPEPDRTAAEIIQPQSQKRGQWIRNLLAFGREESPIVVRPRRLLVLGGQGGVGVSSLVVTVAQWWHRWGLSVAIADAAVTGGLLPMAWDRDPVETGWDQLRHPEEAWRQLAPNLALLAQSGTLRALLPTPDRAETLRSALIAGPGAEWPALLVDGGTIPGWSGALKGLVEGVLLVLTPDPTGIYAGSRLLETVAASGLPIVGFIVSRRRSESPLSRDLADIWHIPCLADWPEDPEAFTGLWRGRSGAVLDRLTEPLAQCLSQEAAARMKGRKL